MCLAVPARIIHMEGNSGIVDLGGVRREASLLLVDDAKVGDYVIVHAGFAIHKIDEARALESLKLWHEALDKVQDKESDS